MDAQECSHTTTPSLLPRPLLCIPTWRQRIACLSSHHIISMVPAACRYEKILLLTPPSDHEIAISLSHSNLVQGTPSRTGSVTG